MKNKIVSLNNLHERELHPFLVRFLAEKMNIFSKTIYHEVSSKLGKGKSEWLHPDLVGFNLPVESWSEKVLDLCGNFSINRATIYSFEIKKIITVESLREQFFQAVSNSSWANEGYLVGVEIDVNNNELMQEMNRLSSAFGIGIIKLNLSNCEDSEIILPSNRKRVLDGETMNKLFNINSDFQNFIQVVLDSIKINHTITNRLDSVFTINELNEILDKAETSLDYKVHAEVTNDVNTVGKRNKKIYLTLHESFKGKTPTEIYVGEDNISVESWKDLYIAVCNYLIDKDSSLFITTSKKIKGKKRPYFTPNENEIRIGYYLEKVKLYTEINLSANSIGNIIKKLFEEFKIDINSIKITIE